MHYPFSFSLSSPLDVDSSRLESVPVQVMLPLLRAPGKTEVVVLGRLPCLHLFQIVDTKLKNNAKQKGNQWPPQPAVWWSIWLVFLPSCACPGTVIWLRNNTRLSLWTSASLYLHCHYCWLLLTSWLNSAWKLLTAVPFFLLPNVNWWGFFSPWKRAPSSFQR